MIRFKCPACAAVSEVARSETDQIHQCQCGRKVRVAGKPATPVLPATASPVAAQKTANKPAQQSTAKPKGESLILQCGQCNRKLRAPASAVGKSLKCPCGTLVKVAKPPSPEADDWLSGSGLPEFGTPQTAAASQPDGDAWDTSNYVAPAEGSSAIAPAPATSANPYLTAASTEAKKQSLPSTADTESLVGARWTMIIVGLILTVMYGIEWITVEGQLKAEGLAQGGPEADFIRMFVYMLVGSYIVAGLLLILLGGLVNHLPRVCTMAGLLIYLLVIGTNALLDPISILSGVIFKIIVIVSLGKAVMTAFNRSSR